MSRRYNKLYVNFKPNERKQMSSTLITHNKQFYKDSKNSKSLRI